MLKDILIVDGYNVIFAWQSLKKLANESLEHARMELRNQLLNYGKFKGYEVILVFDGKYTKSIASIEEITKGFIEVYTDDGETADSFIEREVFLRQGKYTNVYVVTSDGAEQNQILGSGGLRIPAENCKMICVLPSKRNACNIHINIIVTKWYSGEMRYMTT